MRRAFPAALLALSACAAPRPPAPAAVPAPLAEAAPPEVKDPNLILTVTESVPNPADDGLSFTKVYADGKEVGRTAAGRKSETRTLKLKLATGNFPVRLEHWALAGVGEWRRLDDALQPRERFVRVEDGSVARLDLRFSDGEAANTLAVSREAAPR